MLQNLEPFYTGVINANLRPIHLLPDSVRCPAGTWEDHIIHTPEEVLKFLEKEDNVGILLAGKGGSHPNPLGLWALMLHSESARDQIPDIPFTLRFVQGSAQECILLGRLPEPPLRRRSRTVGGTYTVKLTGILPAPGSRMPNGETVSVQVRHPESGQWVPWDGSPIAWETLPIIDPAPYMPSTVVLIPLDKDRAVEAVDRVPVEWIFWHEDVPPSWNRQGFTTAKGNISSRRIRGEAFIRNRIQNGIVSRAGEEGRKTLLTVAVHLVKYLCLPDETVLKLLANPVHGKEHAWNDLCVDARTDASMPWTTEELRSAILAAHEYIPQFGVIEYHRFRSLREGVERLKSFRTLLGKLPAPEGQSPSMKAQDLYETFLEMYNVERKDISYRRFSMAIQTGIQMGLLKIKNIRRTKKKLRYYQGVSPAMIDWALELPSLEIAA